MPSTIYYNAIEQQYVQMLDRPADLPGMQYWEGVLETANGDTTVMAHAFAASSEYKASVAGLDAAHVVAAVYQNMFGHAPDAAGLAYWVGNLSSGAITIDGAVKAIVAGAQGADLHAYINKVSGATAFSANLNTPEKIAAYSGTAANLVAKIFLAGITDDASLSHALAVLAGTISDPPFVVATGSAAASSGDQAGGGVTVHDALVTLVGLPPAGGGAHLA